MEQAEPVLVPQWYKLANGGVANNCRSNLRNCSSQHSDENGIWLKAKNNSINRQSSHLSPLRRSLSSNNTVSKSQAYSSFRRGSRERNREKGFDSRDRENRTNSASSGFFDHCDLYIGNRNENEALKRSHSLRTERQADTWPRKHVDGARNKVLTSSVNNGIRKTTFDKDFPSLLTEGRKDSPDAIGIQSAGLRTAVESLYISAPVIIGISALAEVPADFAANGSGPTSTPNVNQVSVASGSTTCLNMAEALVRTPPNVSSGPQLVTMDSQRIEELTLKKCKQLIPVTPLMPKASSCNSLEKTKSKAVTNSEFSSKFGQHTSQISKRLHFTAGSDNPKPGQAGNLRVLNREKSFTSPTSIGNPNQSNIKSIKPIALTPSAAMLPVKKHINQKPQFDSKAGSLPSTRGLSGDKKLLSQAKNRIAFFNLLRKKSMENSNISQESRSILSSELEKFEVQDRDTTSDASHTQESVSSDFDLNSSLVNGECLNECLNDRIYLLQSERLLSDNEENDDPCSDLLVDPEEEAFLESLGWDKNASVDALTKEEIDGFLEKYDKLRQSKVSARLLSPGKI